MPVRFTVMTLLGVLLSLSIGLAAFWYLAPRSHSFGMFEVGDSNSISRFILSFLATIAGVICGSFYRELRSLQAQGIYIIEDRRAFVSAMFRSVDMWLGMAGAPVVYALLLKATDGMSLPGLLAVALENGFCCLIIVNGFVGRAEQQNAPDPKTLKPKPVKKLK